MTLFMDTSALVKLFHLEEGTERVTVWVEQAEQGVSVLDIAAIEFLSALYRRLRAKEITDIEMQEAVAGFRSQWANFHVEPLGHAVVHEAETILVDHGRSAGLRALDALHLAAFSLIAEADWQFVTADGNQAKVARAMGWTVLNPLENMQSA
jgi:uncharacterized protein